MDWILEGEDLCLPVEVKWGDAPTERDTRHLRTFLSEYPMTRGVLGDAVRTALETETVRRK